MVLTSATAPGYATFFYLTSEQLTHGADCFVEILFRTIQCMSDVCEALPEHLVMQSDNTVSPSKTSYAHMACAWRRSRPYP